LRLFRTTYCYWFVVVFIVLYLVNLLNCFHFNFIIITLYGVKKGKSNVITLGKSKDFFKLLSGLLVEVFKIDPSLISCYDDISGNIDMRPFTDFHESFENGNTNISVVYGSKKIFLIVKCTDLQKKKMFKYVHKTTKWTCRR
jgi:hypothetical protein